MALRVSKEFKWMEHLAAAGAAVEEYATLRQREIDEERKRMIWIKKEEEKQKRQKELRRGKEVLNKVTLYSKGIDMFEYFGLTAEVDNLLRNRVVPCGYYACYQPRYLG